MSQITVIVKHPGEAAFVTQIDKGLKAMQDVVGGNIELMAGDVVGLPRLVDIWFNEEGKLIGLAENLNLVCEGRLFDILVGTAFFASHDDEGETLSPPEPFHRDVFAFCQTHAWKDVTS